MSIFRAVGWLLGVPPAEQRQYSKMLKEDERKNIQKLKEKAQLKIKKEEKFKDLDFSYRVSDLINSFLGETRLSINSNSYKMFEIIVFKYIDDLLEELNLLSNIDLNYLNIKKESILIDSNNLEEINKLEMQLDKINLKNLNRPIYLGINGKTISIDHNNIKELEKIKNELKQIKQRNPKKIVDKHIEIWKKRKTVEELQEVYELAISNENKQPEISKIEMLEKEKRILELEKEIRELKDNNRERQR